MRNKHFNLLLVSVFIFICFNTVFVYANEDSHKAVQPMQDSTDPLVYEDFVFHGLHANQDLSDTPLSSLLGEPLRSGDLFCEGKAIGREYIYSGFVVKTIKNDEHEGILMIILNGPGPKTARGISVEDPIDNVFLKYGKETSFDKDNERYSYLQSFYFKNIDIMYFYHLEFKYKDKKVKEIVYFMSI